jgi:hypothetical protein
MPDSGQYLGSQAFTHVASWKDESINSNTGSVSIAYPLIDLRGLKKNIDLAVDLTYSAGTRGLFGLCDNWSLNLPFMIPGSSLTVQGRTYAISSSWKDVTGYSSGLKYINNHGLLLQQFNPVRKLPSGEDGLYQYSLQHPDGSVDYFDSTGKPLEHDDYYGNYVYYRYRTGETVLLDYIQDSWRQKISFGYQSGSEMVITLPDGGSVTVKFSGTGVYTVVDQAGYNTNFEYTLFNPSKQSLLSKVTYPTGLQTRFDYTALAYIDQNGHSQNIAAVANHKHLDEQNTIMQHTSYVYGSASGNRTYTGAADNIRMGGLTDSLMDNFPDYRYGSVLCHL